MECKSYFNALLKQKYNFNPINISLFACFFPQHKICKNLLSICSRVERVIDKICPCDAFRDKHHWESNTLSSIPFIFLQQHLRREFWDAERHVNHSINTKFSSFIVNWFKTRNHWNGTLLIFNRKMAFYLIKKKHY